MSLRVDVAKLDPKPGQTILITVPKGMRMVDWDAALVSVKSWYPETHVLVVEAGTTVEVVSGTLAAATSKEESTGEGRAAEKA